MAIQLTPELEQRIQAVVNAGTYASAQEALEAAVTAMEVASSSTFEGSREELESLLLGSLRCRELSAGEFWDSFNRATNTGLTANGPKLRT